MSEALQIWLFAGAFGLIAASYIWQWQHRSDCERKRIENVERWAKESERLAKVEAGINQLLAEVGDHEHGIRGAMHKLRDELSPFAVWVQMQMDKRGER